MINTVIVEKKPCSMTALHCGFGLTPASDIFEPKFCTSILFFTPFKILKSKIITRKRFLKLANFPAPQQKVVTFKRAKKTN